MSEPLKRRSVARALRVKIAASPLNPVKLELALVVLVCLAVWLLLAGLATSRALDAVILLAVALAGSLRLIWRTRQLLAKEADDGAQ